jgi:metal-sulfur cluster biosynthetic enzyme
MKQIPVVQAPPPDAPATTEHTASLVPDPAKTAALKPEIIKAISTVFDPEIPVNIWELGLIYDVFVDANDVAAVRMTLTAPGCPVAQSLPVDVANKVKSVPGAGLDEGSHVGRREASAGDVVIRLRWRTLNSYGGNKC